MSAFFQNTYAFNMPIGIAGRIADCGFKNTMSFVCQQTIPPARGVVKAPGSDYQILLPQFVTNVAFTGTFVAGNSIAMTVNGVALTATVFATNTADLLNAVAAKILAQPNIQRVNVVDQTIQIVGTSGNLPIVTAVAVTGGVSQPTNAITAVQGTFMGVTQMIYNRANTLLPDLTSNAAISSGQPLPYFAGDVAPTLTQGRIYVVPTDIVTAESAVLLNQNGTFSGVSAGVTIPNTKAIWREGNGFVGGLAVLELNLP